MALPTSYLASVKNLSAILESIKGARAPQRFNASFLENLGFKGSGDRLISGVLKALKFLDADGKPIDRYFRFLEQSESGKVLAEAIEDAYADLFQVNVNANTLSFKEVKDKINVMTQAKHGDAVLEKMATTFTSLSGLADFDAYRKAKKVEPPPPPPPPPPETPKTELQDTKRLQHPKRGDLQLTYAIHLNLPESRDPAVYDALFRSLREHLL